jgi:four helix bundle protein
MLPYERLEAWKLADRLAHAVYDLTASWPREERYGLVSQARRAALSVAVNICEGSCKLGSREYSRYLNISLGSLAELSYILRFAKAREWIGAEAWIEIRDLNTSVWKCLWALYRSIRRAALRRSPVGKPL